MHIGDEEISVVTRLDTSEVQQSMQVIKIG